MRPRCSVLLIAALVSGCSGAQTLVRIMSPVQKVCPNGVLFYRTAGEVPASYREVALVSIQGVLGREEAIRAGAMYRQHAGDLGANGIVLTSGISRDAGSKILGPAIGGPAERRGMAVAIYIPADSGRVGEACPVATLATGPTGRRQATTTPIAPSASRDLPFVSYAIARSRNGRPAIHRVSSRPRSFDLSGRATRALDPSESPDSGNSEAFRLNPDVRSALNNLERLNIVTGAEEVRPGLVRLSIGEMAPLAQMEYHIGFLHGSYMSALPFGADAVVELWSKGSKMGEYSKDGLVVNEAP